MIDPTRIFENTTTIRTMRASQLRPHVRQTRYAHIMHKGVLNRGTQPARARARCRARRALPATSALAIRSHARAALP